MPLTNKQKNQLIEQFVEQAASHGYHALDCHKNGDPVPLDESAKRRIAQLEKRFTAEGIIDAILHWDWCEPGQATLHYLGKEIEHTVLPDLLLVGEFTTKKGDTIKLFKRFVSHPFYQRGFRKEINEDDGE